MDLIDATVAYVRHNLLTKGFGLVESYFSRSEISPLIEASARMIDAWMCGQTQDDDYWSCPSKNGQAVLYRIHNLQDSKHAEFDSFFKDERMQALVDALYGVPSKPTACALVIKMPHNGVRVPWHRDPVNVPPRSTYNFSIFLDESNLENGCLEFLAGSHLTMDSEPIEDIRPVGVEALQASPGDVAVHDVRVLHGSGGVRTGVIRRSIVVEFRPVWLELIQ